MSEKEPKKKSYGTTYCTMVASPSTHDACSVRLPTVGEFPFLTLGNDHAHVDWGVQISWRQAFESPSEDVQASSDGDATMCK